MEIPRGRLITSLTTLMLLAACGNVQHPELNANGCRAPKENENFTISEAGRFSASRPNFEGAYVFRVNEIQSNQNEIYALPDGEVAWAPLGDQVILLRVCADSDGALAEAEDLQPFSIKWDRLKYRIRKNLEDGF